MRACARSLPHLVGELVHGEVELVADGARRLPRAHHEHVGLALPERALLAVVLHVGAVELHQLHGLLADVGLLVDQLLHQRMPQEVRLLLDQLDLAALRQPLRRRARRRRDVQHDQAPAASRRCLLVSIRKPLHLRGAHHHERAGRVRAREGVERLLTLASPPVVIHRGTPPMRKPRVLYDEKGAAPSIPARASGSFQQAPAQQNTFESSRARCPGVLAVER